MPENFFLNSIGLKYGTDKATYHQYLNFYEEKIGHLKNKKFNLLEIGFLHGNSIKMWLEFFPNAQIFCIDIIDCFFVDERFHYIKISQDDERINQTFPNNFFDVIIDDGSHLTSHQLKSLELLWEKLRSPGFYILEDLHTSFSHQHIDSKVTPYQVLTKEVEFEPLSKVFHDSKSIEIWRKNEGINNDSVTSIITKENKMGKLIDCFTFYNELEILELRLSEIYDVVDKFILVEADKTFKGDEKKFIFDENKSRFSKWMDKIIHVKVNFPVLNSNNPWHYEKYQRNSFMPSLYFLNLSENDKVIISDVDEIPDSSTLSYVKPYPMSGICKLEMDQYFGSFRNKLNNPEKWYHPKILTWGHLKSTTPDNCRNDFNCQWWEKGGWHLSYFGGSEKIVQKIKSFSHQEYNNPQINNMDRIEDKIRNNQDFLDDWRTFVNIEPEKNPYLPKNWRILEKYEEEYFPELYKKKDLVIGAAMNTPIENTMTFLRSFRKHNNSADIFLLVEKEISKENKIKIKNLGANLIFTTLTDFLNTPINNTRYLKFYEFVKEHHEEYGDILITDVRDVYFQEDPFLSTEKNSIFFAQEEEEKIIREDIGFNSRWIEQTYGKEILEKIGNEKITCCGTVLGSSFNCLSYLKFINDEILRFYRDKIESFGDMLDTAIHTYLYYINPGILKNPQMKVNGDLFGTVGITIKEFPEKIIIREGKIEVNGKKPPIIHQYDRSEWLTSFVKNSIE